MSDISREKMGPFIPPKASQEYSKIFEPKGIRKVVEGVYFAFGYTVANVIVLEGEQSLIVIDTTPAVGLAREICADLRQLTRKPIRDVIYTHAHPDHILGTVAFVEDKENPPQIWAHETFTKFNKNFNVIKPRIDVGLLWQWEYICKEENPDIWVNFGVGPNRMKELRRTQVRPGPDERYPPTRLVKGDRTDVTIAGIPLSLLHLPGETDDHLCVWWEERGVFCPGDNIYNCFPSLWPVRGSQYRDPLIWAGTLERMAGYRPRVLCPSHGTPVLGEENIQDLLQVYADGITFVHDQTIRYINQGLSPIEISKKVTLPPSMRAHPYLQQHYAYIPWIVRNIYCGYTGWFSGTDVTELSDVTADVRAERLVALIGREKILEDARAAFQRGDTWWAVEMTSHLLKCDVSDDVAWELRQKVLWAEAQKHVSSHVRSALLANCMKTFNIPRLAEMFDLADLATIGANRIFEYLKMHTNPEKADDNHDVIQIQLTDTDPGCEGTTLRFRHSVLHCYHGNLDSNHGGSDPVARVRTSTAGLRSFLLGNQGTKGNHGNKDDLQIDGDVSAFLRFISCFDIKPQGDRKVADLFQL